MKVIFSRKGFDSGSGGGASPIINGRPISLPIPAVPNSIQHSATRYVDIGYGDIVATMYGPRITAETYCHHDPFFTEDGRCAFGQEAAAQGHLANQGVGLGDIFLFFGLFSDVRGQDRHHRIFGYLEIEQILRPGAHPDRADAPNWAKDHPHFIVTDPDKGRYNSNNSVYLGRGGTALHSSDLLRMTAPKAENPAGLVSLWSVPPWLREIGMTYHQKASRWSKDNTLLRSVGRGQEFICKVQDHTNARKWLNEILAEIDSPTPSGTHS